MSDSAGAADPSPSLQQQIDAICERFAAALKVDSSAMIEDFLVVLPGDDKHELLKSLIDVDMHHGQGQGDTVNPDDYQQRFGSAFAAIEASLFRPVDLSTIEPDPATSAPPPVNGGYQPSRRIGPYKLLQSLGHGGMGEVWMADQMKPVKRRVALKLIKSGMDSKQVLARFEAERQALAMMDHSHIAKVLDTGVTGDGTPYFAMELILGKPITDYCDQEKLGINERLTLFVQVCRAIQHAHQKGILHRDIKPTNVLVTKRDGRPHAKVIDFGLAKAVQAEHRLTDRTLFTQAGHVFGTLEYMSPEQAEASDLGLDTRTDVYSLGVLLFELLTGSTPLGRERIRKEPFHRVVESVLQEEAPLPSRRLSESGDAITGISQQRQIDPKRLSTILKGELDWIALKALEKDRDQRYDGAGSMADDVLRYLNNEVVLARPPSTSYRLKKTVRKNKGAFLTGSTFVLLLLLGLGFTSRLYLQAKEALDKQLAAGMALLVKSRHHDDFHDAFQFLTSAPEEAMLLAQEEIVNSALPKEASSEEPQNAAIRLANAATLLLRLEQTDLVWPLLRNKPDPEARSRIVNGLAEREGRPEPLMSQFQTEQNPEIQQSLLLCLGTFDPDSVDSVVREEFTGDVLSVYQNHKNVGVHSAARWLLQQWNERDALKQVDEQLQNQPKRGETEWFVNGQRQTFAVLGPGEFLMGSPETESHRLPEEIQHHRTIKHRFALCTTEVTQQQWERFVQSQQSSDRTDLPIQGVNWYQAVEYCNWLSAQETIPEDQWCYAPNEQGEYSEGTQVKDGFLQLTGYRLPTEAEWEYACRAGTETRFHFGSSELLLGKYARFETLSTSSKSTAPIASFQPNPWGLFNMHGNVMEWCTDADETLDFLRILRGGSFSATAENCRAAKRWKLPVTQKNQSAGVRVCVTISTL